MEASSSEVRMESVASRRMVVLVEDVEVARTALRWAVHNIFRVGDAITLLYIYSGRRNKEKQRRRRRRGFQLALSFKELCTDLPEVKVEIIVMEGEQDQSIISVIESTGASVLVLGIHDQCIINNAEVINHCSNKLNCRVLAVKQPLTNLDTALPISNNFSQIEICSISDQRVAPVSTYPARSRRRRASCNVIDCLAGCLLMLCRQLCDPKW